MLTTSQVCESCANVPRPSLNEQMLQGFGEFENSNKCKGTRPNATDVLSWEEEEMM